MAELLDVVHDPEPSDDEHDEVLLSARCTIVGASTVVGYGWSFSGIATESTRCE